MALKYKIKTESVYDGEDEVGTVHGLSLNAIVDLVNLNRPAVESIFARFQGRPEGEITDEEIGAIGMDMIEKFPILVAQVIAMAADAYDDRPEDEPANVVLEEIMDYPIGLQFAFLQKIGPLTFNAGGGVKKLIALVSKVTQAGNQSDQ